MNEQWRQAMAEATALTRDGRLGEATARIQQALQADAGGAGAAPAAAPGEVLDVEARVLADVDAPRTDTARSADPGPAPGSFSRGRHRGPAGERAYRLFRPHHPPPDGRAPPLLVMLHGCTQTPEDFATGTAMNTLADTRGWWVLYPAQSRAANRQGCWNWFLPAHTQPGQGEASLIAELSRHVMTAHGLDPTQVAVAGLSAGGAMALALAATHPEVFCAAGVHSGLPYGCAHDLPSALAAMRQGAPGRPLPRPVRTIIFHGDQDTTVHPANADEVLRQVLGAGPQTPESGRMEIEHRQAPGARACTRRLHRDAAGRTDAEQWIIHGGGHAWSGGHAHGSFTEPPGPDASAEMLRFFSE